jgi:two-component system sensor histidine kinase/response regulator
MSEESGKGKVIDSATYADLEAIADGQLELMVEMLGQYLSDGELLLSSLTSAAAVGDPVEIERPAHTLTSASANVGALRLADLCRQLHQMGRSGVLDGAAQRVAQAEEEFALVKTELERRLDKLFGS